MNNPLKTDIPTATAGAVTEVVTGPKPVTTSLPSLPPEIGGRKDGTDPTRYGDWEKRGKCVDF